MDNNLIHWNLKNDEVKDQIWKFSGIRNLHKHDVRNVNG